MGNKMVPEIRFEGFSGDWEERKLGELCDEFQSGKNIKADNILDEGKYPVYGGNGLRGYTDIYSHDGMYVLIGRQGALCGNVNLFSGKGYLTEHAIAVRANVNNSTLFLSYLLNKMDLGQYSSQSAQPGLAVNKLIRLRSNIPNYEEQTKISMLFSELERSIVLHQKQLTILKQTKQGFLQKMFPKEGESMPEIRFPGFSGEWELSKANTIFRSVSDKNYPELPILSASQEKGMVFREDIGIEISYEKSSTINYKRVLPGQFVIHLRSFQGGFAYSEIEGITSPAYTVLDFNTPENHYSFFWRYLLSSNNFIKKLESVTYGIRDGRSISFNDFSIIKFLVPSYNEQLAVGNFLKELDQTITLKEQELEALQQTKKAFLQKMFV